MRATDSLALGSAVGDPGTVIWRSAVSLLVAALLPTAAWGQRVGVGAHYGMGTTSGVSDGTVTIGIAGEVFVRPELVVVARGDVYLFGFSCIGFGACPNETSTLSVGAQYRSTGGGAASFYLGGDIGRTWSPGDVQGWVARPRAGADIHVVSRFYGNGELAYARFMHNAPAGGRKPPTDVLGLSAGLRVRL
jgi:hypothetical protein